MRINHNLSAQNTYRQYNNNTIKTNKSMEKLSSGLRINRAADDAAGLSISEKMRANIRAISTQLRNTQDHISFIQTGEGALNEVSDMLVRMKELIVQRGNVTYGEDERGNINAELAALAGSINDIIGEHKAEGVAHTPATGGTYFNGINTLNDFAAIYNREEDADAGIVAIKLSTNDADIKALTETAIDNVIKEVNTARADFGAKQNKFEHTINNMSTTVENLQAAESRIRDVDMAEEMMEFTKNNILIQASQSMLAQANQQPQGILQLLRG